MSFSLAIKNKKKKLMQSQKVIVSALTKEWVVVIGVVMMRYAMSAGASGSQHDDLHGPVL